MRLIAGSVTVMGSSKESGTLERCDVTPIDFRLSSKFKCFVTESTTFKGLRIFGATVVDILGRCVNNAFVSDT